MGLEMKYFVLKPRAKHRDDAFARASQRAMQAFAGCLRAWKTEPELADDLDKWADDEHERQIAQPEKKQPG